MGNSNGNIHLYWEAFYSKEYPRLQGGFIWDMVDQGLKKICPSSGRTYFGYGGDFGDSINDAQFCINGIFSPDRKPHPSVHEIKYLQQAIQIFNKSISFIDDAICVAVVFTKDDDVSYLSWDQLQCSWMLHEVRGTKIVANSCLVRKEIESNLSVTITLPKELLNFDSIAWLSFRWDCCENDKKEWQTTTTIASGQIQICDNYTVFSSRIMDQTSFTTTYLHTNESVEIWQNNCRIAIVNTSDGMLHSFLTRNGTEVLRSPLRFNITRAFTDNDRGGIDRMKHLMPRWVGWKISLVEKVVSNKSYGYWWRKAGLDPSFPPQSNCTNLEVKKNGNNVVVQVENSVKSSFTKSPIANQTIIYTFFPRGAIMVNVKTVVSDRMKGVTSIPRIGFSCQIDKSFHNIEYFGRGPYENYCDRKQGSEMRTWVTSASKMGYDYIVPSENGNRCDCFYASFTDNTSNGFSVVAKDRYMPFQFSALLHSQKELHEALHTYDLDKRSDGNDNIFLSIDSHHMGIGGDVGWSPCVYPQYILKPRPDGIMYYATE
jgi:beta-galactosidase